jgi:hypothetical protein
MTGKRDPWDLTVLERMGMHAMAKGDPQGVLLSVLRKHELARREIHGLRGLTGLVSGSLDDHVALRKAAQKMVDAYLLDRESFEEKYPDEEPDYMTIIQELKKALAG